MPSTLFGSSVPQDRLMARARAASRYRGFELGDDHKPRALTVLDPHHLATYAHGGHANWPLDKVVEVRYGAGWVCIHMIHNGYGLADRVL